MVDATRTRICCPAAKVTEVVVSVAGKKVLPSVEYSIVARVFVIKLPTTFNAAVVAAGPSAFVTAEVPALVRLLVAFTPSEVKVTVITEPISVKSNT